MNLFTVFAWIVFYLVVVTLFYYCFRHTMSAVQSTSSPNDSATRTRTTPTVYSDSNNPRSNERRTDFRSDRNRNVFVITGENDHRPSDASDLRSPPSTECKWEDLPPSYEEAMGSFTNPTFNEQQPRTSVVGDSTVIAIPASAASVN